MPETRSPWRRAFNGPLLAAVVLFTVSGSLVLAFAETNLAIGIGAGLLSFALIAVIGAIFLAIGYGEDDERAREERIRRTGV